MAWLPSGNRAGLLAGNFMTNSVGASKFSIFARTDSLFVHADVVQALPLMYSWITSNCKCYA